MREASRQYGVGLTAACVMRRVDGVGLTGTLYADCDVGSLGASAATTGSGASCASIFPNVAMVGPCGKPWAALQAFSGPSWAPKIRTLAAPVYGAPEFYFRRPSSSWGAFLRCGARFRWFIVRFGLVLNVRVKEVCFVVAQTRHKERTCSHLLCRRLSLLFRPGLKVSAAGFA